MDFIADNDWTKVAKLGKIGYVEQVVDGKRFYGPLLSITVDDEYVSVWALWIIRKEAEGSSTWEVVDYTPFRVLLFPNNPHLSLPYTITSDRGGLVHQVSTGNQTITIGAEQKLSLKEMEDLGLPFFTSSELL